MLERPVEQRLGPAPAELVEYIALDNRKNGFPQRPSAAIVPDDFRRDVEAAIAEIPQPVKRALGETLAGIYFLDDLGGTGFTDRVLDEHGKAVAAFIVLDRKVLSQRTANGWATWRENTPFKPGPNFSLTATLEAPESDDRRHAIQYILLHEIAHVLSINERLIPGWWTGQAVRNPGEFPFFALSWRPAADGKTYVPLVEDDFALRKQIVLYAGARLTNEQMVDAYNSLLQSNFPTLYAATNPYDDFAETFAMYVHTELLNKPFEIDIRQGDKLVTRYTSCLNTDRCATKKQIVERLLAGE